MKDLSGIKFGRLTIASDAGRNKDGRRIVICACDCGNKKMVLRKNVLNGNSKSCGCLQADTMRKIRTSHGMSNSKEYLAWVNIKTRCMNPSVKCFKNYGGRGIKICKRWMKFENFLEDMGEPPSGMVLDRKNNSLGYSKSNCKWSTFKESTANRSNTIFIDGERVFDMARRIKIPASRIYARLKRGWSKSEIESNS